MIGLGSGRTGSDGGTSAGSTETNFKLTILGKYVVRECKPTKKGMLPVQETKQNTTY